MVEQKKIINKARTGKYVTILEMVAVVLVKCILVDNQYRQQFEVFYTFTPNKCYAYLINTERNKLVFL